VAVKAADQTVRPLYRDKVSDAFNDDLSALVVCGDVIGLDRLALMDDVVPPDVQLLHS
jgi:hypothetical protein